MWGVLTLYGPHWVCLTHSICAFPIYTAQTPGCSAGELSKAGPVFHALPLSKLLSFRFLGKGTDSVGHAFGALPRSEQLRQQGAWRVHCPRWPVHLNHLPSPSCFVSQVSSESAFSSALCVSSGELISGCDPPGRCQSSKIPRRLG